MDCRWERELLWRQIGLKLLSGWKGKKKAAVAEVTADDATKASFLI